jgi:hypothetical protein
MSKSTHHKEFKALVPGTRVSRRQLEHMGARLTWSQ